MLCDMACSMPEIVSAAAAFCVPDRDFIGIRRKTCATHAAFPAFVLHWRAHERSRRPAHERWWRALVAECVSIAGRGAAELAPRDRRRAVGVPRRRGADRTRPLAARCHLEPLPVLRRVLAAALDGAAARARRALAHRRGHRRRARAAALSA